MQHKNKNNTCMYVYIRKYNCSSFSVQHIPYQKLHSSTGQQQRLTLVCAHILQHPPQLLLVIVLSLHLPVDSHHQL